MQTKDKVRLCLIGAGSHSSRNIYPHFRFVSGVELVANADLNENKAKAAARLAAIPRSYTDYHEMLDRERPDGVIVCVGAAFHEQVAPEIMELGYHVYVEKPPATTLEGAKRMLAARRTTGKICMTAFKKRFAPAYVKAKQIIQSQEFGRPLVLNMLRTTGSKSEEPSTYLFEQQCHAIDLVHFLFGPVTRVSAFMTEKKTLGYSINLQFANGAVGNLSTSNRSGCWEEVSAIGSNVIRVVTRNSIEMVKYRLEEPVSGHYPSFIHGATSCAVEQGFVGELQEFVNAIREGRAPESSIEQSVHTMAIYEAIIRSVETGEVVPVEQVQE